MIEILLVFNHTIRKLFIVTLHLTFLSLCVCLSPSFCSLCQFDMLLGGPETQHVMPLCCTVFRVAPCI